MVGRFVFYTRWHGEPSVYDLAGCGVHNVAKYLRRLIDAKIAIPTELQLRDGNEDGMPVSAIDLAININIIQGVHRLFSIDYIRYIVSAGAFT